MKIYFKFVAAGIFLLAMLGYILPTLISANSSLAVLLAVVLIIATPVAVWKWIKI